MAYETGTAADYAALALAFRNFLTANGWTLTGSVLHKGNAYGAMGADVANSRWTIQAGTGQSAGALTGAGPVAAYIASPINPAPVTFPVTYHFHTHGDEAYGVLNWGEVNFTSFGFGCSPVAGLPGTGVWYFGSYYGQKWERVWYAGVDMFYAALINPSSGQQATGPFWTGAGQNGVGHYVHHGLDGGTGWSATTGGGGNLPGAAASAHGVAGPLLARSPSAWNGQTILLPIQPLVSRPSNKVSIVAELRHLRYVSMANYAPGDIITLGPDRWQVFPFWRRGTTMAPGNAGLDTGFLGVAFRYDGP